VARARDSFNTSISIPSCIQHTSRFIDDQLTWLLPRTCASSHSLNSSPRLLRELGSRSRIPMACPSLQPPPPIRRCASTPCGTLLYTRRLRGGICGPYDRWHGNLRSRIRGRCVLRQGVSTRRWAFGGGGKRDSQMSR
jgi:hypothetical protein